MTAKVETQKVLVKADRSLVLTERVPIVEGNVAVDQVEFTFEEPADWKDLTITAYFTNSATEITEYVNLGTLGSATKKTAKVPASVTQDVGFIGVALLGSIISGSGDNATVTQRAATQDNSKILKVYKSGVVVYNPDPEGPLTPSMIEEAEAALNEAIAAANRAEEAASAVLDVFDGATEEEAGKVGQVPAPAAGETDLVLTGNAEWTDVHDLIPDKADIDGYYELLTAGAADNLTGRGDTVAASFLYRTAGGSEDIADGIATIECVKGNTVGWNQLLRTVTTGNTNNGITYTPDGNGGIVASGTAEDNSTYSIAYSTQVTANHKYLLKGCPAGGNADTYSVMMSNYGATRNPRDVGSGIIFTALTNGSSDATGIVKSGTTVSNLVFRPQLFDLTQIFGAGKEPSTVAEFEALYPEPYYPYDPGTLKPVQFEGIETVGFNCYDPTDGTASVLAGNVYQISGTYTALTYSDGTAITPDSSGYFTPVQNDELIVTGGNDSTTCIHLKWSGYRDGEYEAFWKQQREIAIAEHFPTGMKSAGSVCDALYSDHADHVVGSVDLGTLTWTYNYSGSYFRASYPGIKRSGVQVAANARMSNGFESVFNIGNATDRAFIANTQAHGGDTIYIKYLQYGNGETVDLDGFKAAINGVILYYELATPTTETIDPPLNLGYKVSDFGTERVMVADGEISAPPVFEIAYGLNATDTIRRLPTQYISDDSFKNFCDEAYGSGTVTETWDDVNNCYTYSIAEIDDATIAALVDADWRD